MGSALNAQRDICSSEVETLDFSVLEPYKNMPDTPTSNKDAYEEDFKIDATVLTSEPLKVYPITKAQLCNIDKLLDLYEKISIVYLLKNDNTVALHIMKKLKTLEYEFKEFLTEIIKHKNGTNELIEALCVIQNYQVLKMLGYKKEQLESNFSPMVYHTCIYINKTRKLLYRIIENLTEDEERKIIQSIKDVVDIDLSCFEFMEIHLAYLFQIEYIRENDLSNIIKHFKALEFDHYVDLLSMQNITSRSTQITQKSLSTSHSNNILNTDKSTAKMGMSSGLGSSVFRRKTVTMDQSTDIYHIDENNPGIVLMVENINFYEDPDDTYKDLVIVTNTALQKRDGSIHDSRRIGRLFKRFGYTVIHKTDLTHIQMLDVIEDVSHNKITGLHSSFILIMLSHGLENQIIGCNSVPLNVDEIKKNINSKVLEGKPKILIFQACQGNEIMRDERSPSDDVVTDGPRQAQVSNSPWQRHILEMWSTVPGYASFRSMSRGSWLIQTLCDVLESPRRVESFAEICTHVHRKIGERWVEFETDRMNVMVPNYISTLDKKFFLPPLRNIPISVPDSVTLRKVYKFDV